MDTTAQLARRLGISVPRVHRELDKLHVSRTKRGVAREIPHGAYAAIAGAIGATPLIPDGTTREQVLILAALIRSPLGLTSARAVATKSGTSPTVASRILQDLEKHDLVERKSRVEARGRAMNVARWHARNEGAWPHEVLHAARSATLPTPVRSPTPRHLPRKFQHLFWNTDSSSLALPQDATYVAHRLLTSGGGEAMFWALQHLPSEAIEKAISIRGVDTRTKSLARLVIRDA
ncbi:helix-turn-helix domain-containing protein [Brooklawnia sp.]|uniref:MarR family transcriptional regulator n=1 Tax=Brooklawnia sp. TaxID=2699740 RepID=UPI00311F51A6